jgi:hypothetical protein
MATVCRLRDVTSRKELIFIVTIVRISILTNALLWNWGYYEHGNKLSGSMKFWEALE